MKLHFDIVFALLSYFVVCLMLLGWLWVCMRHARRNSGDDRLPPPGDGPRHRPPKRPKPTGDRTTHPKRNEPKPTMLQGKERAT